MFFLFFFICFYLKLLFSDIVFYISSRSPSNNSTGVTSNKCANTGSSNTTKYTACSPAYNSSLGTNYGSGSSTS